MMDWFEEELGIDYPWQKVYRNVPVRDFLYRAMENTPLRFSRILTYKMTAKLLNATTSVQMLMNWHTNGLAIISQLGVEDITGSMRALLPIMRSTFGAKYLERSCMTRFDGVSVGPLCVQLSETTFLLDPLLEVEKEHYDKGSLVLDMYVFCPWR